MLSRITIEMDFDSASPFIQILCNHSSPDLRDRTVSAFLEKLGHKSRWATLTYQGGGSEIGTNGTTSYSTWKITPIKPFELREEAGLMLSMADHLEGQP